MCRARWPFPGRTLPENLLLAGSRLFASVAAWLACLSRLDHRACTVSLSWGFVLPSTTTGVDGRLASSYGRMNLPSLPTSAAVLDNFACHTFALPCLGGA